MNRFEITQAFAVFRNIVCGALGVLLIGVGPAHAWMFGDNLTITAIMLWENENANVMHFKTSAGFWCSVQPDQKTMRSLVITLYSTQKPVMIHCHGHQVSHANELAHPLHRLIAK